MKTFDQSGSNDTFLTGGLIAIAIAWIAFSALQGPTGASAFASGTAPTAAALRASQSAPAVALPGEHRQMAANKVS